MTKNWRGQQRWGKDLQAARRKRVAALHAAVLQAVVEPAHALCAGAVGKTLGHHAALALLLEAVVAEIYPALAEVKPEGDEIIDRAQVRAVCEQFARLDEAGKLGAAFGPQSAVSTEVLDAVEQEEGWILGV